MPLTCAIGGAKPPELQVLGELEEEQPGFPGTGDKASLHAEQTVMNPQPGTKGWAKAETPWGARDSRVGERKDLGPME